MGADKKPVDGGRDKKDDGKSSGSAVSVFKVGMYCDGCAKEIKRVVKHMDGVEDVKVDIPGNKLTVTGKVDAAKIKARLEEKTNKKVDIVSQPKKVDAVKITSRLEEKTKKKVRFVAQPKNDGGAGEEKKVEKKKHKLKKAEPEPPKEKTKKVDKAKELIAVTGTMDVQELMRRYLQDKLSGSKDVVPTNKKEKAINIYISGDVNFYFGK